MAALPIIALKQGISTGTGAVKTVLQVKAPANQRLVLDEIGIGFYGVNNTAPPISVDICFQSTAGTMTTLTLVLDDPDLQETIQSTAQYNATVEPTTGNIIRAWPVHPQTNWSWAWPEGKGPKVKGGTYIGMRVNNSGAAITVDPYMKLTE